MRTPLTPHSSESEGFAQSLRSFTGSLSARCGGPCKNPSLSVGFAALRAPHPFPLAALALANYLKLTALRESLSLSGIWAVGPHPCPACGGALQKKKKISFRASSTLIFFFFCGEGGIRTPGAFQLNSFQDCRNRPLYHLSKVWRPVFGTGLQI